jgi:hypothetical protein
MKALIFVCGVTGWTLHDLRRTFSTGLASLGVAPHIIERLINHSTGVISGVSATYNRVAYMPEMRQAVEKWDTTLPHLDPSWLATAPAGGQAARSDLWRIATRCGILLYVDRRATDTSTC